jgi:hypoxanthine phosphoribosyltransferase
VISHDLPAMCDRILYSEEQIARRVEELGAQVPADYDGHEIRLVTVLRGGLFFMADLARAIQLPVAMDFLAVAPYGPGAGGVVRVTKDLDDDIRGAAVVLVEDVVDTGLTLNYVKRLLEAHAPRSVEVCALLDKQARRIADVPLAYTGFAAPDRFLVGYGLDVRGRYRELPYVATVKDGAVGL